VRCGNPHPATGWAMRRGDVFLVNLGPSVGAETNKARPAILVSNDAANATANRNGRGVVTVVPITSNTTRVYPFQVRLSSGEGGIDRQSKAQAEQLRSVDVARLGRRLGSLRQATLHQLDDALRLHLAL
jgi:mRNA interferase MazF